jgi:hypothetical protein
MATCFVPLPIQGLHRVQQPAGIDRGPRRPWKPGPPIETAFAAENAAKPIRIGYARCSTAQQELASHTAALEATQCKRVFSEKISTRIKVRPELEKARKPSTSSSGWPATQPS